MQDKLIRFRIHCWDSANDCTSKNSEEPIHPSVGKTSKEPTHLPFGSANVCHPRTQKNQPSHQWLYGLYCICSKKCKINSFELIVGAQQKCSRAVVSLLVAASAIGQQAPKNSEEPTQPLVACATPAAKKCKIN